MILVVARAGSEKVYDNFMQIVFSIDLKSASQMCVLLHSTEVLLVGALALHFPLTAQEELNWKRNR